MKTKKIKPFIIDSTRYCLKVVKIFFNFELIIIEIVSFFVEKLQETIWLIKENYEIN